MGRTLGSGTSHLPAFSLRFCLMVLERTFARLVCSRSRRYAGMAPGAASSSTLCLLVRSLCCWMVFFIVTFSVALLGVELRLEAYELLRHRAALMRLARLLLALLLIVVQPAAVPARGGEGGKRPSDPGCFAAAAVSRRKTGRGAAWMRGAATRARVGGGKRGARRRESVRTASGRARCVRSAAWCLALSVSRLSTTAARSRTPTRREFSPSLALERRGVAKWRAKRTREDLEVREPRAGGVEARPSACRAYTPLVVVWLDAETPHERLAEEAWRLGAVSRPDVGRTDSTELFGFMFGLQNRTIRFFGGPSRHRFPLALARG